MNEREVQKCFIYSKMPIVEERSAENSGAKSYLNIELVEFMEFIIRIFDMEYQYQQEPLFIKLESNF
jgi:hypothetical protein